MKRRARGVEKRPNPGGLIAVEGTALLMHARVRIDVGGDANPTIPSASAALAPLGLLGQLARSIEALPETVRFAATVLIARTQDAVSCPAKPHAVRIAGARSGPLHPLVAALIETRFARYTLGARRMRRAAPQDVDAR